MQDENPYASFDEEPPAKGITGNRMPLASASLFSRVAQGIVLLVFGASLTLFSILFSSIHESAVFVAIALAFVLSLLVGLAMDALKARLISRGLID